MRLPLILALIALPLSGCQSVLAGLQKCERHYDGTVAGGGMAPPVVAGKALVDCCPVGTYSSQDHTYCIPLPSSVGVGATVGGPTPAQPPF